MHKILIANRGEIAVRVIRACRDLGLGSVAIFSDCDRAARHVRMADEAVAIGGNPPADSYLRIDRIIDAARATGADAVHPGYGFLSENEEFASACREAGADVHRSDCPRRSRASAARRPRERSPPPRVCPSFLAPKNRSGPMPPTRILRKPRNEIGYPVLIKAVAGGGGKGMRVVSSPDDLRGAHSTAPGRKQGRRLAIRPSTSNVASQRPRHVEIQILADHHGNIRPFVERECSIQRRHQKVIEESPSPAADPALRSRLADAAVAVAKAAGYTNAGTVEFLLDEDGRFYFLEVNARLQVEHPVTEMVAGVDLVQWQIRIAVASG